MANPNMRNMIKLLESAATQQMDEAPAFGAETPRDADGRLVHQDVGYDITDKKVTATMASHSSQVMTKLAQKVQQAKILAEELKGLEEDIKAEARELIGDVFGPADELRTRVVETVSFEAKLAVAAKDVPTTKYEKVVAEVEKVLLEQKLPELLKMLNEAKAKYTTYADKAGALSVKAKVESIDLSEGVLDKFTSFFAKFKQMISKWAVGYDSELRKLNVMLGGNDVNPLAAEAAGGPGSVDMSTGENLDEDTSYDALSTVNEIYEQMTNLLHELEHNIQTNFPDDMQLLDGYVIRKIKAALGGDGDHSALTLYAFLQSKEQDGTAGDEDQGGM